MIIKLASIPRPGGMVAERVFVGEDLDSLQLAGTLNLRIGEWQLFGAALLLGAQKTKGNLEVITEGSQEVVESTITKGDHP